MEENTLENSAAPVMAPTDSDINYFGLVNYRNQNRKFGIKIDDRRRHMYVVGKTGMGKTTILENMVLNDIYAGHGVGLVDPHGDFAEKIIDYIPPHRINDVVYFNPADIDFPIGFNILETVKAEHKHLVASGLMGVFKKIWPDVWSSRMEYILNNTLLALLDYPGTTLLGINRLLADADYRKRVVHNLKDPVVKAFWQNEFAAYNDKYRQEAVAPIQNKIGQFLSASVIRNIVAQVKSRINIREIMDSKKIFIMNLSKGRIGEDNSRLLGGMLITKIQLAAMERVDTPEKDRKDFFLYVDEFQNFATESFANILSEARKYRLDLTMAHQYMEQLEEEVLAAVIGNVGSIITFRVGSTDAEILAKEFIPTFIEEDLINLPKFHIYLKLMIDGIASRPFSALTLPPIAQTTHSTERVIKVSRERYAVPRENIEDKIARWSGMVIIPEDEASELEVDEEEEMFEKQVKKEEKKVVEKPKEELEPESKPEPVVVQDVVKPEVMQDLPRAEPVQSVQEPVVQSQPSVRPTQSSSTPQVNRTSVNVSGGNRNGGQGGNQNFQSSGKKKKKKHHSSPGGGTAVSLVDTSQKGISLNSLGQERGGGGQQREPQRSQQQSVQTPVRTQEERKDVPQVAAASKPLGPETIGLLPKGQHQNPPVGVKTQSSHQPVTILPGQVNKIEEN